MKIVDITGDRHNRTISNLVRDTAWANVTSRKSASRRLQDAGINADPDDLLNAADLHKRRASRKHVNDPLEIKKLTRERRLQEYKRLKALRASPMYKTWRADFRKKVEMRATVFADEWGINAEAQLATLEAIVRASRKQGWQVRHTSKHNDRASSRYIIVPNVGECRVSNHEIPETMERVWRREEGQRNRWNGEVVIGSEWRTIGLSTWLRRVLLAAAGR